MDAFSSFKHRDAAALSDVVHRIYEAGLQPECWNAAVAAIARSLGCTKALLFTPNVPPQQGGLVFPCGIPDDALQLWASSYSEHDIWSQELARRPLRAGDVLLDEDMVPRRDLLRSKFYTGFLRKIGIGRACVGLVSGNEPGLMATSLAVFRSLDEPPFDESDIAWMKLLVSHVSRSFCVMRGFDVAHAKHRAMLASFDRLCFGAALLDAGMRVVHVNAAAQQVLARKDGLAIGNDGRLESTLGARRQQGLSQWLDMLRDAAPARRMQFLDGCLIPRKEPGRHYAVQCAALASQHEWHGADAGVHYVAFITDPAELRLPGEERLLQLYGLTQTQSRVALAFAGGASYKEAARNLGISEETVRSHVKEIYPKTRVNRQAELVRLVLSLGQTAI